MAGWLVWGSYMYYGEFVDAEVRPVKELCARNGGGPWRSAW